MPIGCTSNVSYCTYMAGGTCAHIHGETYSSGSRTDKSCTGLLLTALKAASARGPPLARMVLCL
jgi:hypothetical protein